MRELEDWAYQILTWSLPWQHHDCQHFICFLFRFTKATNHMSCCLLLFNWCSFKTFNTFMTWFFSDYFLWNVSSTLNSCNMWLLMSDLCGNLNYAKFGHKMINSIYFNSLSILKALHELGTFRSEKCSEPGINFAKYTPIFTKHQSFFLNLCWLFLETNSVYS